MIVFAIIIFVGSLLTAAIWVGVSIFRGTTRGTWRCIFGNLFNKKEV